MTDLGRKTHKEWRKDAKKARRKIIRQQLAIVRKEKDRERENSPTYLLELEKKRLYEEFELEKEARESKEQHKKWLEQEELAQKKWREEQRLKKLALEEKLKEQDRIRKEWEAEQKKIREQKEKLEAFKKEEERRQKETLDKINDFIFNGGELPVELQIITETNPGKEVCSFFQKVGACRFGNQCSRNHYYYRISNILLFSNFYSHFTLDQSRSSEYDTDISLEFEDSEMYLHFKEFYNDILPEFKKCGEVTMVKVCCNIEFHLRGNVYVEYETEREAVIAYQKFQGRWYGGKQLHIEFVKISDWGGAVCGDFIRHRCPKGKSCNFLHVFRNPRNEYSIDWHKKKQNDYDEYERLRRRSWRWSESPGPSVSKIRDKFVNGCRNDDLKRKKYTSPIKRKKKSRSPVKRRKKSSSLFAKRKKSRSPCRKSKCEKRESIENKLERRKKGCMTAYKDEKNWKCLQ